MVSFSQYNLTHNPIYKISMSRAAMVEEGSGVGIPDHTDTVTFSTSEARQNSPQAPQALK